MPSRFLLIALAAFGFVRARDPATKSLALRRHAHFWPVLRHAASGFMDDRVMAEAAGVTFYAMLALFPAIAALISLYGLVADPSKLYMQLQNLGGVIPGGGIDLITDQMKSLTQNGRQALGTGFAVGLATSLWSANAGIKALFDALNVVWHERETRSYIRLTALCFCFTFGLIIFLILALFAVVVIPVVLGEVGLGTYTKALINIARWPIMLLAMSFALSVAYHYGPNRKQHRWKLFTWGGATAALLWVIASLGFSYYVANFGSYNKTYGSLGAAMGFMTWIWVSAMVVLFGAEINAGIERETGSLPPVKAPEPLRPSAA